MVTLESKAENPKECIRILVPLIIILLQLRGEKEIAIVISAALSPSKWKYFRFQRHDFPDFLEVAYIHSTANWF